MKIGVFDSGIGGLNVLNELLKKYPNNNYIYYGDTLNVPYGNKSKDELLYLSSNIIHFFEEKNVDLIIIACGTISSTCFNELKKITNIPLYDVITPTIEYINNSDYFNIGLIGTTRTIESNIFNKNIINRQVFSLATPEFVPIIENNLIAKKELVVADTLKEFKDNVDCLILGCTHYPLLKTEISNYLSIPLIDMGYCLANSILLSNSNKNNITLYFSLLNENIISNINNIITMDKDIILVNK